MNSLFEPSRSISLVALALSGILFALAADTLAAPAQTPLLNRAAKAPAPNMMITVDDSGSMQVNYIPEGTTTVNGHTVTFPSQYTNPTWQYFMDIYIFDPTHQAYLGGGVMGYAVAQAVKGDQNVFQRQMRSAAVNRIYYDPAVRYLPWYKPDGTRFANASPTAARWDPVVNYPSNTVDLTTNLTGVGYWGSNAPSRYWCVAYNQCDYAQRAWYPGLYYVLKPGADPNRPDMYDEYDINDGAAHSAAVKNPARTDCAGSKCTQAEERQNFANWFQFYRSRILLTKAAISEVIGGANPATAPRFGFASINSGANSGTKQVDGLGSNYIRKGVRDFSTSHTSSLLDDIQNTTALNGTPLKSALLAVGSYFTLGPDNPSSLLGSRTTGSPWRTDPSSSSAGAAYNEMLSCRRSYNILMTDGYYNLDPGVNLGNVDGANGTAQTLEPSMQSRFPNMVDRYFAVQPFTDTHSNTLADHASYFYVRDLAPTIPNKVTPITGDLASPNSWQHLGQFTVGLGVSGSLPAATAAQRKSTVNQLSAPVNPLLWPTPGNGGDSILAGKIDDLFHAAVNTGGDFFQASNSSELTAALRQAIGRASAAGRVDAGVAGSGSSVQAGLLKFVPTYTSGSWNGDLKAFKMEKNLTTGALYFNTDPAWVASKERPDWAVRNMVTWDPDKAKATQFGVGMDLSLKQRIGGSVQTDAVINYLRGDTSNESGGGGSFRPRDGAKLPAFINAPPLYVKNLVNMGYTWDGYADFVAAKSNRTGMVFVGGGGGFLHGFDASSGVEKFAYMPKGVQRKAAILSDPTYGTVAQEHQYFVDGQALEADAFLNGSWRSLVIGTMGAGGRGVYAIDVTSEAELANPSLAASKVLWDFSEEDGQDGADVGYIHTAPEVGRVNGTWYAFVPNGTHSSTGKTVLFAINLETKAISRVEFDEGSGGGLTGVRLLRNDQREAVALYGTDLKGRVWRLDFDEAATVVGWRIGFDKTPLFQAKSGPNEGGTPQPITVKPTLSRHYLGGYSVLFGTGKLLDTADSDDTAMQTLYGVWDPTGAEKSAATRPSWADEANQRAKFKRQEISTDPVVVPQDAGGTKTFFRTSSYPVDWEKQRGWYMDLTLPSGTPDDPSAGGQRLIYEVGTVGEFAFFYTVKPGGTPEPCESSSGASYNFIVESVTGSSYKEPVIDLQGDQIINERDKSLDPEKPEFFISGFSSLAEGQFGNAGGTGDGTGKLFGKDLEQDYKVYCLKLNCKISDRVWKQIISPPQPK